MSLHIYDLPIKSTNPYKGTIIIFTPKENEVKTLCLCTVSVLLTF